MEFLICCLCVDSLLVNLSATQVDMRTLHECALEEMFSDKHAQLQLQKAAGKTTEQNPFVLVPTQDNVRKRLTDQMKNRLSMLFPQSFLQQDLGCEITQQKCVLQPPLALRQALCVPSDMFGLDRAKSACIVFSDVFCRCYRPQVRLRTDT